MFSLVKRDKRYLKNDVYHENDIKQRKNIFDSEQITDFLCDNSDKKDKGCYMYIKQ